MFRKEAMMLSAIHWDVAKIAVVAGCAIPIVAIVGGVWRKVAIVTSENDLKRRMIDRGMSADEIEKVLNASSSSERPRNT